MKIILNIENIPNHFSIFLLCLFHIVTYIDGIYTFNTFESLHTAKTKKTGGEIEFNLNFSLNAL